MAKRKKILQQGYEIFIKILGSIVLLAALVLIVMKIIDADKYKSVSFEYLVVLIVALLVLPSLSQIEAFGVKLGIREKVESLSARFEALPDYIIASDYYQQ